MPSLLILIPLLGIILLNLLPSRPMRRIAFWFALVLCLVQIALAINHYPPFWGNELDRIDSFFRVSFSVDHLSFVMLLCIGIVSLASLLIAKHTVFDEKERFKFINLLIIASIGMSGIVTVRDLFSLYIFLEITAIASFILIAFEKSVLALEGSFKYMILSAVATVMMLTSIALLLLVAPDTSFSAVHEAVGHAPDSRMVIIAMGIFGCGILIKGGIVPFHGWLPDAYSAAPSAASVLLAGIVTKAAGIYTLIRILGSVFGYNRTVGAILLALGALSIVAGALAAMGQKDLKRMLAYSSISQVGYIIMGFAIWTPLGIAGAIFHIFNHAIFKSLLFVNAAAVETRMGTNDMDRMGGLAQKMPYTGTTSVIGMLSAGGVPPLGGFWSKLIIIIALWQSGHIAYSSIAAVAGVLTLAYLLIMQRKVFFGKLGEGMQDIREAHTGIVIAAVMLAAITVGVGLLFPAVFHNFAEPVKELLMR
jgi:multicomponent Na+:H+ antiporter subunit D